MIRVFGVILPDKKHIVIALRSIYGVGATRAQEICKKLNLDPAQKVAEMKDDMGPMIQKAINDFKFTVEGDLRREVAMSIKRLVDIKSYRGIRHRKRLPLRGQRTHTNANTARGKAGKGGKGKSGSK